MTVGKISAACWIFFVLMSVGFLPLGLAIASLHALPVAVRLVLAIVVVGGLWWGPFGYGMYLSMAVIKNGDRRLLKRGIAGTAVVLAAKATNTVIQSGQATWQAPRVHKYRLKVSIPGWAPYETDCSICASGIGQGSTVKVAVSRHNRKRVTIDVGQGGYRGTADPRYHPAPVADRVAAAGSRPRPDLTKQRSADPGQQANATRIAQLAELGRLHKEGVLTDAEFAAEKARILR
jgi:hypothetical protein